jgi:hypothetical protein
MAAEGMSFQPWVLAAQGREGGCSEPVAAGPHRADRLGDLADQLIAQLTRPAVAGQPGRHGRLDGSLSR